MSDNTNPLDDDSIHDGQGTYDVVLLVAGRALVL